MYFAVSGVELNPLIPVGAAALVSVLTSMGGVSGAVLLMPFQVSVLGFASPAASATNHLYNLIATPGGVVRYAREGRLLWPLALLIASGSIPGIAVGAWVRVHLVAQPESFRVFVSFVILLVAGKILLSFRAPREEARGQELGTIESVRVEEGALLFLFEGRPCRVSIPGVLLLALAVGTLGGAYGIGGGAIIAPFLISVFRVPVYAVAGASLLATFLSSLAGVGAFLLISLLVPETPVSPDWLLGGCFGIGGLVGTYLGGRCQRYVSPVVIKGVLLLILLAVALRYLSLI